MPCRVSSNNGIEIVMSFDFLNVFKPNEHTEDFNTKKLLFEIEDKSYIYVADKVVSFKKNDEIINYSSKLGHNDIK